MKHLDLHDLKKMVPNLCASTSGRMRSTAAVACGLALLTGAMAVISVAPNLVLATPTYQVHSVHEMQDILGNGVACATFSVSPTNQYSVKCWGQRDDAWDSLGWGSAVESKVKQPYIHKHKDPFVGNKVNTKGVEYQLGDALPTVAVTGLPTADTGTVKLANTVGWQAGATPTVLVSYTNDNDPTKASVWVWGYNADALLDPASQINSATATATAYPDPTQLDQSILQAKGDFIVECRALASGSHSRTTATCTGWAQLFPSTMAPSPHLESTTT